MVQYFAVGSHKCNIGRGPVDNNCNNVTQQGYVQRYAPQDTAITSPILNIPGGWLVYSGVAAETNNPYTWLLTYALEYPVGGTIYPVTWNSGSPSITVSPGTDNYASDPVAVTIPAGQKYVIRDWGQAQDLRPPTATLTVSGGQLSSTSITDGGIGLNTTAPVYTSTSAPAMTCAVPVTAGSGSGGAIVCVVTTGVLTALNLTAGSGYTDGTYALTFASGANMARATEHSLGDTAQHGAALPDVTQTPGLHPATYDSDGFYAPILITGQQTRAPAIGLIMDSILDGTADQLDPGSGHVGAFEKSIQNRHGWVAIGCAGELLLNYITRHSQQSMLLASITHLVCGLLRNDVDSVTSAATIQTRLLTVWAPYLSAGIKVYQVTCLPTTTSTDDWATTTNQTVSNAAMNNTRVAVNDWLRTNAAGYGVTVIDMCSTMESGFNSGLFNASAGGGSSQLPAITIVGGVVTACSIPAGTGYPASSDILCEIYYPEGAPGSGLVITAHTNGSGAISSTTVNNGGSAHVATDPPLIGVPGAYTNDGVHPSTYGHFRMTAAGLFAPSQFVLPALVIPQTFTSQTGGWPRTWEPPFPPGEEIWPPRVPAELGVG